MATKTAEKPFVFHKAEEVIEQLGKLYPSGTYSFLTQVRNGTGYSRAARTADAVAMSLWPSRGLDLIGFEVKVSRSDWISELRSPEKADAIAQYCDYWYLVVGDEKIVELMELPSTWGLLVPDKKRGLKEVVRPTRLKAKEMDRVMLAGLMRNVSEQTIAKGLIESELEKAREKGKEWGKYEIERLTKEFVDLSAAVREFEKASGVKIGKWEANKDIGAAVRLVLDGKARKGEQKLKSILERAEKLVAFLKDQNVNEWEI